MSAYTGDAKLKIIASALNFEHCRQIVEAYVSKGCKAEYVHSREDGAANQRVMQRLNNHELDVIVQVRKLGEGFDHPYLSVAAVFSIFSNLSPFVQFVGRIMRVIVQNAPGNILNQGAVVFHAGANIARQWSDFQAYSEADQQFFDNLLPVESVDPASTGGSRLIDPMPHDVDGIEVRGQSEVHVEEMHLLKQDEELAIRLLQERGLISADFDPKTQVLEPVPMTRVAQRQAKRSGLDIRVKTAAGKILHERGISPAGKNLDKKHLGKDNFVIVKGAIDTKINQLVGKKSGSRDELSRSELELIENQFEDILLSVIAEVVDGN